MPILFHDDVKKGIDGPAEARALLRSFLDKTEPELIQWLYHTWQHQGKAITYKQLREMIMNGDITPELLLEWQQDYSVFVVDHIKPLYVKAMTEAVKQLERRYPLFAFDSTTEGVKNWTDTMAASFVTRSTDEQINAVRWAVARASQLQDLGVDELARVIRPMVGLNRPQTVANMNYYTRLIQGGTSQEKAKEAALKYAARQHRYRGHMIARTELAFAFNKGEDEGVRQAIDRGYMGRTVKKWVDAGDDRVCDTCRTLHKTSHKNPIEMDGRFGFDTKLAINYPDITRTPPAHPHCRCVVVYEELEPPTFSI